MLVLIMAATWQPLFHHKACSTHQQAGRGHSLVLGSHIDQDVSVRSPGHSVSLTFRCDSHDSTSHFTVAAGS